MEARSPSLMFFALQNSLPGEYALFFSVAHIAKTKMSTFCIFTEKVAKFQPQINLLIKYLCAVSNQSSWDYNKIEAHLSHLA